MYIDSFSLLSDVIKKLTKVILDVSKMAILPLANPAKMKSLSPTLIKQIPKIS